MLRAPSPPWVALALAWACSFASQPASAESGRIYVSNETGGDIAVIDPGAGTVVERIPVGKRPRGLKLSRDGKQLLVALSGSPIGGPGVDEAKLPSQPTVPQTASGSSISRHASWSDSSQAGKIRSPSISRPTARLYVSNEETAEMSVLDLASGDMVAHVRSARSRRALPWGPTDVSSTLPAKLTTRSLPSTRNH